MKRAGVLTIAALALGFPFLALLAELEGRAPRAGGAFARELAEVAALSAMQAGASALAALALGLAGAAGLFWAQARLGSRAAAALRLVALAPSALPPLIAILAWMALAPGVRGLGAVVALHALVNAGLVAIAVERAARAKIGGQAELALAEGASRLRFWRKGALPLLAPDLAGVALFVFAACFASFAIPLALGGARAATLELVVYERVRAAGDLGGGLIAAAIQTFFILSFAALLGRSGSLLESGRSPRLDLLAWAPGVAFALAPGVAALGALAVGAARGARALFSAVAALPGGAGGLPRLAAGSLAASLGCGLACLALWLALAYARPAGLARRAFVGYAAPSATLTGLALWLALPTGPAWSLVKIALGTALLAAPALHRLEWDARLDGLRGQIQAARALGASDGLIFARVTLPQLWRPGCALAGIAAFWAWGDFALSSVVSERRATVAQLSAALMDTYRLDAAMAASALALLGGALTFGLFWGAGHVDRA